MISFNQNKFNEFALYYDVIGFSEKPFQLSSGRLSNWYLNWRNVAEDVFLLDRLTHYVTSFTRNLKLNPDCFYGVPEGATKLGVLTQYKWAKESKNYAPHSHVLPMGRGKVKDHGAPSDKYFVGKPKGKTIIIEDVTTTGDSLLKSIDQLQELEVPIIAAFSLTNRMQLRNDGKSVQQAVQSRNVSYHALSNAFELLPEAYKRLNPGEKIAAAIEKEFEEYGVEKIRLI